MTFIPDAVQLDFDAAEALVGQMTPPQVGRYRSALTHRGQKNLAIPYSVIARRVLAGRGPTQPLPPFDAQAIARKVARGPKLSADGRRLDSSPELTTELMARIRSVYPDADRHQLAAAVLAVRAIWDEQERVQAEREAVREKARELRTLARAANGPARDNYSAAWDGLRDRFIAGSIDWLESGRRKALVTVRAQKARGRKPKLGSQWLMEWLIAEYDGPDNVGPHGVSRSLAPAANAVLAHVEPELAAAFKFPGGKLPATPAWWNKDRPYDPGIVATPEAAMRSL